MGFRSHLRSLGIRLLESLVGTHPACHEHHHQICRVCAAERAIRADDASVCASHLLTHLDSLAPPEPLAAVSSPSFSSIRWKRIPSRQATPKRAVSAPAPVSSASTASANASTSTWACSCAAFSVCASGYCWCSDSCGCACGCTDDDGTPHWVTGTANPNKPGMRPSTPTPAVPPKSQKPRDCQKGARLPECSSLVQALQGALVNVRYAISGHLALQLQASRTRKGQSVFAAAFASDSASPTPEELASSTAAQPSLVCPRSTRDVLPSWAAASRGRYSFGFDVDLGHGQDRRQNSAAPSSCLRIDIDGVLTAVYIDWIDDEQFNRAPYAVEDMYTGCRSRTSPRNSAGTVPVLSVASLLHHAANAVPSRCSSASDDMLERLILGAQWAVCMEMLRMPDPTLSGAGSAPYESNEGRHLLHRAGSGPQQQTSIRRKPLPRSSSNKPLSSIPM